MIALLFIGWQAIGVFVNGVIFGNRHHPKDDGVEVFLVRSILWSLPLLWIWLWPYGPNDR